jgi:DNA-binding transcriptional ArsR family regulator
MKTPRGLGPASSCETTEHARRRVRRDPSRVTLETAAQMFEAAGNPERLALLIVLRDGARSVAEIATRIGRSPSLVSQHLGILRAARLVRVARHGRFRVYELFDRHAQIFLESAVALAARIDRGSSDR